MSVVKYIIDTFKIILIEVLSYFLLYIQRRMKIQKLYNKGDD